MNLILLEEKRDHYSLPRDHRIFRHLTQILKIEEGDTLKAGVEGGGPLGVLRVESLERGKILLSAQWKHPPSPSAPVTMIIGTPRPPVAKRLIKDLTAIGISQIFWVASELGEKSYFHSKLWREKLYTQALREGAEQGCTTLYPEMERFYSLKKALKALPEGSRGGGIYLHPGQGASTVTADDLSRRETTLLAVGPERGWTEGECESLEQAGFEQRSLTERILRTETVCSALALMAVLARQG